MANWTTIGNDRMTGGGLWLPELSINLIGNDYAAVISTFDMEIDSISASNTDTNWNTQTTFYLDYPAIAHDDNYNDMTLRVALFIDHASDDGNVGYSIRFYDNTNSVASSTIANAGASMSSSNSRALLTYASSAGAWPTGVVEVRVQVQFSASSPASTMSASRTFGNHGPQCAYAVVAT